MKKVYSTKNPNKKPERQIEAIKHEISKYVARERRKTLPVTATGWDFDCKVGQSSESAQACILSEINSAIDALIGDGNEEFYVEVVSKPRAPK